MSTVGYIITSRGLSYICDIPRKEQYIPIAWASALSVSDCWAMREASSSEMDDWNVPRILFIVAKSLIGNIKATGTLPNNDIKRCLLLNIIFRGMSLFLVSHYG